MSVEERIKLLPPVTDVNRGYWEGTRAGELRVQVCGDCGTPRFPPSSVCPRCLSDDASWQATSGRGRVWSWTRMHQRYLPAFDELMPYLVLYVDLDEGPRMVCGFVGSEDELEIDLPVEVVFEPLGDERVVPMFRPVV